MATVINSLRDRADTLATALKSLYVKLGGELTDKPDGTHTVAELVTIPECVDAITYIAEPGGGGGSSDFSTAEVTITDNSSNGGTLHFPYTMDEEFASFLMPNLYLNGDGSERVLTAVLYKGSCALLLPDDLDVDSMSGDISSLAGALLITGDCAITLTDAGTSD